jgi:hypothetical protein
MKCFVATALGKPDVDKVYNKGIRPILRELGVKPLRIDRVEHNDDIDNKIFALLNEADFCIADLTYARPSAYYEAGYAFGSQKPVVYIVRSDHFKNAQDAERVHFDLQMKNIIGWTEPNEAFKEKLRKRLRHVLAPLLKKRQVDAAFRNAEIRFKGMSEAEQVDQLFANGDRVIRGSQFRKMPASELDGWRPPYVSSAMYWKSFKGVRRQIHFVAAPKVPSRFFVDERWRVLRYLTQPEVPKQEAKNLSEIRSLLLLAGLRGPTHKTLMSEMSNWRPQGEKVFASAMDWEGIPNLITIAAVDNPKSVPGFSARVLELLSRWEAG